jgi:hypothetical protein
MMGLPRLPDPFERMPIALIHTGSRDESNTALEYQGRTFQDHPLILAQVDDSVFTPALAQAIDVRLFQCSELNLSHFRHPDSKSLSYVPALNSVLFLCACYANQNQIDVRVLNLENCHLKKLDALNSIKHFFPAIEKIRLAGNDPQLSQASASPEIAGLLDFNPGPPTSGQAAPALRPGATGPVGETPSASAFCAPVSPLAYAPRTPHEVPAYLKTTVQHPNMFVVRNFIHTFLVSDLSNPDAFYARGAFFSYTVDPRLRDAGLELLEHRNLVDITRAGRIFQHRLGDDNIVGKLRDVLPPVAIEFVISEPGLISDTTAAVVVSGTPTGLPTYFVRTFTVSLMSGTLAIVSDQLHFFKL